MRIFFYTKYDRQGASSRYRTYQYQEHLEREGFITHCHALFSRDYLRDRYARGRMAAGFLDLYRRRIEDMKHVSDADLAVVEKEFLPYLPALLERKAFREGKRILLDYDDAVFENYRRSRNPTTRLLLRNKIPKLLEWADGVTCGSAYLASYARERARRVWLVPTVVDTTRYLPHDHEHEGLISIGWIGTPWSARYLPVVRRAVERVAREVPIRLIVIGAQAPAWEGVQSQSHAWSEEKEAEWIRWLDIGIMPLVDTPFERGKCGLKLLQYMAAGVVPVASDVGGNRDIIRGGVDGFLCRTEEEWVDSLLLLARDVSIRKGMAEEALVRVRQHFSLTAWAPRLASIYREVLSGER